jgi:hypothetical protein
MTEEGYFILSNIEIPGRMCNVFIDVSSCRKYWKPNVANEKFDVI